MDVLYLWGSLCFYWSDLAEQMLTVVNTYLQPLRVQSLREREVVMLQSFG